MAVGDGCNIAESEDPGGEPHVAVDEQPTHLVAILAHLTSEGMGPDASGPDNGAGRDGSTVFKLYQAG